MELERYYFNGNDWNVKTYFIVYDDGDKCPCHTFLIYEKDNKYCWFEHSWKTFRGIHKYNSLDDLLADVKNKFIKEQLRDNYSIKNLFLFEYGKPKYHISVQDFFNHCHDGKQLNITNL